MSISTEHSTEGSELELAFKLVKQAPIAMILLTGADFKVKIANDRALEFWRRELKDVYNLPVSAAFPEFKQPGLDQVLEKVYTTGEPFEARETAVTVSYKPNPEKYFINFMYEPLRSGDKIAGIILVMEDVTDEVATRKTIEESEQSSFELLAQAAVGITVYQGEELRVVLANDRATEIWGKSQDDLIGKPVLQISPELKDSPAYTIVRQVLNTGTPFEGKEIPIRFKRNGENHTGYFDVVYTAWRGSGGLIKGVITVYTEVTHSVLARKKVEEKEAQLRIALEGGALGYFDYFIQTGKLIWSERLCEMFGIPADTPASLELFFQVLHPEDREAAERKVQEAMAPAGEGHYDNEYRIIAPVDGKLRWLRSRGKTTFDETRRAVRFSGVVQDITREKLAEEKITRSEGRFRSTFENAAVGIAHVGLDGSWLMTNDRLSHIIGYTREELVSKTFQDITHPDDLQKDLDLLHLLLARKIASYSMQKRYVRKDRNIVWINLTVSLAADQQGQPDYFISIIQDISEQKRAEDALKQSEEQFRTLADQLELLVKEQTKELHRSNEDLQQFAHVASHDLKEPVRKVIIFGNRLRDEYADQLPDRAKVYIGKIDAAAKRMYSMINGVLLYSSLDALGMEMEPVSLNDVIRNVQADLEVLVQQKAVVIEYQPLPVIVGSPVLIHQLFYNLINNCIKFAREEESSLISINSYNATPAEISQKNLDPEKNYYRITVRDNGIGFNQADAEKIFHTFTRLNSKDRYEGTGLGLALCKKIADRHGGSIYAEGREGEGAVFTVLLPR